jgi:hypothetical protein
MSTKTLRKRIALVAVAALGAGVLSVAPANAGPNVAPNNAGPAAAINVLNIGTTANTSGSAVLANTAGAEVSSIGLLTTGDYVGTRVAGTTQTATMLSTGTLAVYTKAAGATVSMISVTGGTITGTENSEAFSATLTSAASASGDAFAVAIKPNAGATSMIVKLHTFGSGSAASLLNGTNTGTLKGQIFVTVAASSVAGVLAASKSGVFFADTVSDTSRISDSTTAGIGSAEWATTQFINVRARDAYSTGVGSLGILSATATNGALVDITASGGSPSPINTSDFYTGAEADNAVVTVAAPSSAPVTTTVTVTWNGTVIGSKTLTFTGEVAKVTLSSPKNGLTGNSTAGTNTATIVAQDAAGNTVYLTGSNTPASSFAASATTLGLVTGISLSTAPTSSAAGRITFSCGSVSGSTSIAVTYTNNSGSIVTSNALPVTCGKIATSYTASYDKASYAPGEIATLTVAFKDKDGNSAADSLTGDADNATHVLPVISVSGVTLIGAALAADDFRTSNGALKYTFIVGTTEGQFTNSVNFPQVATNATAAGLSTGLATTATLKIAAASGAVSMADVLKAIVSLIASINKQIAALQKALLKK